MLPAIRFALIASLSATLASAQSVIHLKTRDIETAAGAAIVEIASPNSAGPGHLLMQFRGHPTPATVRALARRGIRVLGDVAENGLLVAVERPANIAALGAIYAVPIPPRDKVSPQIDFESRRGSSASASANLLVEFHPDTNMNRARGALLNLGIVPLDNPDLNPHQLMIQLDSVRAPTAIAAITLLDEVAYVFPASRELALGIPARYYAEALTTNGPAAQSTPTFGEGWDGPGLGGATIGYVFSRLTTQLDSFAAQSEIRRAMAEWSKVAQIMWQPGGSAVGTRTVNILFAAGAHGDGFPFDGPGGALSHTFYPPPPNPEPIAGDMHFDDAESWRIGANTDLFSVALHELGHALGLGHSDDPAAVMYPYYKVVTTLAIPDKIAILSLYAAQTSVAVALPAVLTLTVNSMASTTTASSVNLSGSATGGMGVITVQWRGSGGASGTAAGSALWNISNIPLAIGTNIITITASAEGSQISKSVTITRQYPIFTDTTAPSLTIKSPSAGTTSTTASTFTIAGIASDNIRVVLVSWATNFGAAGVTAGTTTWSAVIPLLVGNNSVTIRAFDAAGNAGWRSVLITRR